VDDQRFSTPIVIMIYNRPDLTRRVFEEIARVKPKKLLVIADGPRSGKNGDMAKCEQARYFLKLIDWECEVKTNISEINLGLKRRVSSGLNWVFDQVEDAIVLEDDCLPQPGFFQFCEEMLGKYRDDERVVHVGGVNLQFGKNVTASSYYFSIYPHVWGWATWRRAWKNYDVNMSEWPVFRDRRGLQEFLGSKRSINFWRDGFEKTYSGQVDTWAVQWVFACWKKGGLSIIPAKNLISNIGYGFEATHTRKESRYARMKTQEMEFPLIHPPNVVRERIADRYTEEETFSGKPILIRMLRKLTSLFSGIG
jgi:hypothetical protein